jgi:hypothetical protein
LKGPNPGVPAYIETLRQLQRWIRSVGTEDTCEPPSEHAAVAAIDLVLKANFHLREDAKHQARLPCSTCKVLRERIQDAQTRVAPHVHCDAEGCKCGDLARSVLTILRGGEVGSG